METPTTWWCKIKLDSRPDWLYCIYSLCSRLTADRWLLSASGLRIRINPRHHLMGGGAHALEMSWPHESQMRPVAQTPSPGTEVDKVDLHNKVQKKEEVWNIEATLTKSLFCTFFYHFKFFSPLWFFFLFFITVQTWKTRFI